MDKRTLDRHICDAADVSGFTGKQWAIQAHRLKLYGDLVEAIQGKLGELGYSALPARLQGKHEVCRIEGDSLIVTVEQVIESDGIAYDSAVFCREMEMRPVISEALAPIIKEYADRDFSLLKSYLGTQPDDASSENIPA